MLRYASQKGVRFLLSNVATQFILDLYRDYKIEIIQAKRAISARAEGGEVNEVLVMNFKVQVRKTISITGIGPIYVRIIICVMSSA